MGAWPGLKDATVAVTGGSGFIGRRLVERLIREGAARAVVLDRHPFGGDPAAPARDADPGTLVDARVVDLASAPAGQLREALDGVTTLVHLAAEKHSEAHTRPEDILTTNVLGTHAVLRAARAAGVKRIVFASSVYAYGRARGGPLEESETPEPRTVYGISKLAGEQLCAHAAERGGPEYVALRYFFAYGPGQTPLHGRASLIVRTFERLASGEPPEVRGDGLQTLDYVYVDDIVEATMRAMTSRVTGETLNVGSGRGASARELIGRMQHIAGTSFDAVSTPADDTAGTSRVAAVDKTHRALGWTPHVDLDTGLARTWDWVRTASPRHT